jgi:hypothetical protein
VTKETGVGVVGVGGGLLALLPIIVAVVDGHDVEVEGEFVLVLAFGGDPEGVVEGDAAGFGGVAEEGAVAGAEVGAVALLGLLPPRFVGEAVSGVAGGEAFESGAGDDGDAVGVVEVDGGLEDRLGAEADDHATSDLGLGLADVGAEVLEVILPALEVEPVEVGDLDVAEALDVGLDDALVFVLGGGFGLLGEETVEPEAGVGCWRGIERTEHRADTGLLDVVLAVVWAVLVAALAMIRH